MEKVYYDLSPAQKILLYAQTFTLHKQVNNICTGVFVEQDLDLQILEEAIRKAYKRNDSFQVRLCKIDKKIKQYYGEYQEPDIKYLDFRNSTEEKMERKLYRIAKRRVTRFEKPLSKIYLLHSFEGKCGLYFVVSHMIMDSWGISVFLKDILAIYHAISTNTEMPKPLTPYKDFLLEDLNYRSTEIYRKDREFFEELFKGPDEPIFNHINGPSVLEKFRKKKKDPSIRYASVLSFRTKGNVIMIPASKDLVKRMEEYCTSNRITMQSLILLAYRSFLSKMNNREKDVSIYTVIARRGTLKEKNTGGTRVHFMPFRTIIEEGISFKQACETIGERQNAIYRHASIDPLEVKAIMNKAYNIPRIGSHCFSALTFQPVRLSMEGLKIRTKWYSNGSAPNPIYITVMDDDGSGGLKFYYEYQTANISQDTLKNLHDFMVNFIEAGITKDDSTIGELLDRI